METPYQGFWDLPEVKPLPLWEVELMETPMPYLAIASATAAETASLMGSGINGNNTSPVGRYIITSKNRFPYGKWN